MIAALFGLVTAAITLPECPLPWLDAAELERRLGLETHTSSVGAIVLEVVDCENLPDTVRVELRTNDGALLARRSARLRDISIPLKLRVLALVIGEMIEAPEIEPEPAADPPPTPARVEVETAPPEPPSLIRGSVIGTARHSLGAATTTFGARLAGALQLDRPWFLWASLGAEGGGAGVEIGSATFFAATATFGAGLSRIEPGLRLGAGPAIEVGYAIASGSSERTAVLASSTRGAIALAMIEGHAGLELGSNLWLEATLALGTTLVGLVGTADGIDALGIDGPMARIGLGLGTDF